MKAIKKLCQATLTLVLTISLVFGTGIKGVFANVQSGEYQTAIQEQTEFMELLSNNMESYKNALNLLSDAEELNSNDQATINNYIDTLINSDATTDSDEDSLNELKNLLIAANEVEASLSLVTDDSEKELYSQNFKVLVTNLVTQDNIDGLADFLANIVTIIPDFGLSDAIVSVSSTDLSELEVNGLQLNLDETTATLYVGYEVIDLEVVATPVLSTTRVEIIKPSELVVGNNEVRIIVTPLSGQVKEYILNVVRLKQYEAQGDGKDEATSSSSSSTSVEPMVATQEESTPISSYVSKSTSSAVSIDETEDSDKKEVKEYDEEVAEEKGLNGLTILLIVAGIALIGFGIYMLFGDKDDDIPEVKTKKVNNIGNTKTNNSNKKTTNKKKK